jgi:hypothetical protein
VRYVHLPASEVDRGLLEDASRRGQFSLFYYLAKLADREAEAANQAGKPK